MKITLLSVDGSIKKIPLYLKDEMVKQGWKIVSPDVAEDLEKKGITYLPQHDQTINKEVKVDYSDINPEEENNVLEVEVL